MAYLFNSLEDNQNPDQGKQNIFSQPSGQAGAAPGGTPGNDSVQKGSTSTSVSSGGGGGSAAPSAQAPAKNQAGYNPAAASDAYASASQSMNLPTKALKSAEGSLNQGEQSLQDKANAYQTSAQEKAKDYKLDTETLKGAAAGQGEAYQKTAQRLGSSSPELFGGFEGLGADQPNIQNIRDTGSLYRAEAGPNYSAGQSRFDSALLRRNPEFIAQQQALLGREKALKEKNAKEQTEQTAKARGDLASAYGTATTDIKNQLGSMASQIPEEAKAAATAEAAKRAGINPGAVGAQQQEQIKKKIEEDLKAAEPHSEQYRSLKFLKDQFDLGQFANVNKDVNWQDFIDKGAADRYNRIEGLLGNADNLTASQGGPAAATGFNEGDAYKYIVNQLQEKRRTADEADRQKLAQIQAGATSRLGQTQADLKSQYEAMLPQYQAMRASQVGGPVTENGMTFTPTGEVVMPQYQQQDLSWQNMLTPDEVAQLNATQEDLGVLNPTAYQNSTVNPYAQNKALQDEIFQWQKSQQQQAPTSIVPGKPGPYTSGGAGGGRPSQIKQKTSSQAR